MAKNTYELQRCASICSTPEEQLVEYVENNKIDKLRNLVNVNPNILQTWNEFCCNIIQKACRDFQNVHETTIATLIELGVDIYYNNEADQYKQSLHFAAFYLKPSILKAICAYIKHSDPTKINALCQGGNTALNILIKKNAQNHPNFLECASILIESGIDINIKDQNRLTPLYHAAKYGNKDLVKLLLNQPNVLIDPHKVQGKNARYYIEKLDLQDEIELPAETTNNNLSDAAASNKTLLQIACEKGLEKDAKDLIEQGVDVNELGSLHKTTPILIAAEEGHFKIIQILLDNPTTIIPGNLLSKILAKIDNKEESAVKNYNACFEELLKTKRYIDFNYSDEECYTPLHYASMYGDSQVTLSLLNKGACLANKNNYDVMPVETIPVSTLEEHFDNCVTKSGSSDFKCNVFYDFSSLITTPPKIIDAEAGENACLNGNNNDDSVLSEMDVIAYLSKNKETQSLLKHPVIASFLFMKWSKLETSHIINLLFYFIFCVFLYFYIIAEQLHDQNNVIISIASVMLYITFPMLIFREVFQFVMFPRKYVRNVQNCIEIFVIAGIILMLSIKSPGNYIRKQICAIVILLTAFQLILLIEQIPRFTTNIVMLRTVIWNFFNCLLWYAILIFAFAISFFILFGDQKNEYSNYCKKSNNATKDDGDEEDDSFIHPGLSLFKTIVMLTGEFDASSIEFCKFPITSRIIFIAFVFIIAIVLINLLNGLAVSDIQLIKSDAELCGLIARAEYLNHIEKMVLGDVIANKFLSLFKSCCCLPDYGKKQYRVKLFFEETMLLSRLLKSKKLEVSLQENGKVLSTGTSRMCHMCNVYLDKNIVKRTIRILQVRKQKELEEAKEEEHNKKLLAKLIAELKKMKQGV